MPRPALLAAVWCGAWMAAVYASAQSDDAAQQIDAGAARAFFRQHCLKCHGEQTQEAKLRLDGLAADFARGEVAERWTEVMDRLNSGEMPPPEEPQPDAQRVVAITEWIAKSLAQAAADRQSSGGEAVLRRLNRDEYNNTIRDLLAVDFRPGDTFPADPPAHGFDNVGAALQISPLLMEKYLKAAREIVDQAIATGERPPSYSWHLEVEEAHRSNVFPGRQSAGEDELWVPDRITLGHRYIIKGSGQEVRDGMVVHTGSQDEWGSGFRWFRVPNTGRYRVRVRAAARVPSRQEVLDSVQRIMLQRNVERDWKDDSAAEQERKKAQWLADEWPQIAEHFRTDPIYGYGAPRMKVATEGRIVLGEVSVDATVDAPQVYEFDCELTHNPAETQGIDITNNYRVPRLLENNWFLHHPDFARPELLVDWVELEGIYADEWPPESHLRLFPSPPPAGSREIDYAREVLARFMGRAYRRPVEQVEVDSMLSLFGQVRPHKESFEEAIKVPLTAVLSSPHFLFLVEPATAEGPQSLSDYQIASRLSYFLWSSMPDDALFTLAAEGKLSATDALRKQVDRMLADPRSGALVRNFAGQWLGLREVGSNPPVESLFPRYDSHLEESMVRESEAFFAEILQHDLSVMNLIQSDFAMLNERLARFYGIPEVRGDRFRRVDLPEGARRGGVLTQASVLTLTSNGTRTSPVVRGVWILENLLGDPPPPPPPDAGDLAPSVPGIDKATVRDRLEAHRRIPQCASCHQKIDPLGFALENFDAHGRWRDQYGFGYEGRVHGDDPVVDASGRLPDGRRLDGVESLQAVLLADEDRFLACLTEKMMIYALGRGLEARDRPLRDKLVADMKADGYTLRSLIKSIVTSEAFLTK